jgi:chromosome segregation ATPase
VLTPAEVDRLSRGSWSANVHAIADANALIATLRAAWAERDKALARLAERQSDDVQHDAELDSARRWARLWKESAHNWFENYHIAASVTHPAIRNQRARAERAEAEVAQLRERIADAENIMSADTMAYAKLSAESNAYREQAEATGKLIVESYGYQRNFEERCAKAEAEVERLTKALELVEFSADDNETRLTEYIVKLERLSEVARELQATADNVDVWNNKPSGPMASDYEARGLARQHLRAALAALQEAKP